MPTSDGLVGNESVTVLRDTCCSEVIVKKDLVKKSSYKARLAMLFMTVVRTLLKAPFANVEVSTPYFRETLEALCLKDLLYELTKKNIPRAKASNDPDKTWCVKAAAVTRSQSEMSKEDKLLKVVEIKDQLAITRDKLIQLQEEESFRLKYMKEKGLPVKNGKERKPFM